MPYFHISTGLRGCFMPDSAYVLHASTRRELKAAIEEAAEGDRQAGYIGLSKAAITSFAARVWRERKAGNHLPHALPYRRPDQDQAPYGIFVSTATRREYLEDRQRDF